MGEVVIEVLAVDERDHPIEDQLARKSVPHQQVGNEKRLGESTRLDDQSVQVAALTGHPCKRLGQLPLRVAAQAPVRQLRDLGGAALDEGSVDSDFAELVHQHAETHTVCFGEDSIDECRLTAAEET